MSDHLDIRDQICQFLASPDHYWSDELTDTAVAYAALCREAGLRLRRCQEYLRRGMRSEAVHLAACQPPLPDVLRSLEIPDLPAWERASAANGVPAPPRLPAGPAAAAAELEAARAAERGLEPLLARLRVLAVAGAAITERLAVLRALAERDPGNPCWTEGLRELEPARLREMRVEAKAAFRDDDGTKLEALAAELAAGGWQVDVPGDLRDGLNEAVVKTWQRNAVAELRGLLPEMLAAYEGRSLEACEAAVRRWQELLASVPGGVRLPAALEQQVRPAVAWAAAERDRSDRAERRRVAHEIIATRTRLAEQAGWRAWRAWPARVRVGLVAAGVAAAAVLYYFGLRLFGP